MAIFQYKNINTYHAIAITIHQKLPKLKQLDAVFGLMGFRYAQPLNAGILSGIILHPSCKQTWKRDSCNFDQESYGKCETFSHSSPFTIFLKRVTVRVIESKKSADTQGLNERGMKLKPSWNFKVLVCFGAQRSCSSVSAQPAATGRTRNSMCLEKGSEHSGRTHENTKNLIALHHSKQFWGTCILHIWDQPGLDFAGNHSDTDPRHPKQWGQVNIPIPKRCHLQGQEPAKRHIWEPSDYTNSNIWASLRVVFLTGHHLCRTEDLRTIILCSRSEEMKS